MTTEPSLLMLAASPRPVMKGHLDPSVSFLRMVWSSMALTTGSNGATRFVNGMLKKSQDEVPVKLGMANKF